MLNWLCDNLLVIGKDNDGFSDIFACSLVSGVEYAGELSSFAMAIRFLCYRRHETVHIICSKALLVFKTSHDDCRRKREKRESSKQLT